MRFRPLVGGRFDVRSSVSAAPTAPSAAGVRIETIADAAGFRALRDEWTRLLERHGWRGSKGRADVCPFIDLAGLTWDSYLATLSASHRYNVKRRLKAVSGRFDVRFEVAESDEQRRQALATLIDLHTRRWNLRGGSTALYSARLVAFHEDISRIA